MNAQAMYRFTARLFKKGSFVPKCDQPKESDVEKILKFVRDRPKILVFTGAGISTESGLTQLAD